MGKSQKTGIDARLQAFAEWNTQYHQQLKAAGKEALARFDDILSFAYREENTPQQGVTDSASTAQTSASPTSRPSPKS